MKYNTVVEIAANKHMGLDSWILHNFSVIMRKIILKITSFGDLGQELVDGGRVCFQLTLRKKCAWIFFGIYDLNELTIHGQTKAGCFVRTNWVLVIVTNQNMPTELSWL